jgi:hypothetical protein
MKSLWIAAISIVGLMVLSSITARAQEPSLADVARMNRAARQPKKATAIVIDDDAMIVSGSATKPVPAGAGTQQSSRDLPQPLALPGQAAQKPVPGSRVSAAQAEDECAQLKKELDDLKVHEQGWKRSAAAYEEKLAAETSEFRRTMYQDALDNDRRNVSFYRQKINEAESKLAEAEAAKSGSANEKF